MKLYEIWTSGLGDVLYRYFLSGAVAALLLSGAEPFVQFSRTSLASPTVFKDLNIMKNTDLSVQILGQKLLCLYLVQHMLHQIKA